MLKIIRNKDTKINIEKFVASLYKGCTLNFNGETYTQSDGVAVRSPLEPFFASTFMKSLGDNILILSFMFFSTELI